MYATLIAHIQNTTPQLTPNKKSCIRSSLLQRSFENLAKFLVRKTLTIGAKVLSPFSLSDQFLTHVPYSCLILSLHTQYTTVSRDCQVFFCIYFYLFLKCGIFVTEGGYRTQKTQSRLEVYNFLNIFVFSE